MIMLRVFQFLMTVLLVGAPILGGTAHSEESVHPFLPGEKLVYEISYFGIAAGYITLEYEGDINMDGEVMIKIKGIVKTSKFFSLFYNIEDIVDLYAFRSSFKPYRINLNLKEGGKKKEENILYDYSSGECVHSRKGKVYRTPVPPEIQDAFSSIYYFRKFLPQEQNVVTFNVYSSRKVWTLEAPIISRETLNTPVGEFKSFMIKPVTRFEGILQAKGDVIIWFSDDEKRIPLKLSAKIKLGSLEGNLMEYRLRTGDKIVTSLD